MKMVFGAEEIPEMTDEASGESFFSPSKVRSQLNFGPKEIRVWFAFLDRSVSVIRRLEKTLSEDERARAGRFHFRKDKERFVAGRGILRTILGRFFGVCPSQLQFRFGENGKPAVVETYGRDAIGFNVSHSEGLGAFAFTIGREIGVDIEYIRKFTEMDQMAHYLFSPSEIGLFQKLSERNKVNAFFRCWTRKEAFLKAIGKGLSWGLEQVEVSFAADEPARLRKIQGDERAASRWSIMELSPPVNFSASLAVEDRDVQIGRLFVT